MIHLNQTAAEFAKLVLEGRDEQKAVKEIVGRYKIDRETDPELELHLIIDNYCTHKHERIARWLKRHKRFHLHFIPTSSSWLNLVERWFREITDKRIRRGAFKSVGHLVDTIMKFIETHNADPKPFVWSAPVERILSKIAKCKEVLGTLH